MMKRAFSLLQTQSWHVVIGVFLPLFALVSMAACEGSGDVPNDAGNAGEFFCEAHALDCASELVAELLLSNTTVATQSIVNNVDNEIFLSEVDATAGGVAADPRQPFLYARFEADGLQVVALSDDEALDSNEWDIAFHRYLVRLNGGSSGPSCIQVAAISQSFDDVTKIADGASWAVDEQFTGECVFRAELEAGDPANERDYGLALSGYYNYVGCLQMTQQVFALRLDAERQIKLKVVRFYDESAQLDCDELGSNIPIGSAHLALQWAFIDADE